VQLLKVLRSRILGGGIWIWTVRMER